MIFFVKREHRLQLVCVCGHTRVCLHVAGLGCGDEALASGPNLREHLKDSVIEMNEILFKVLKTQS